MLQKQSYLQFYWCKVGNKAKFKDCNTAKYFNYKNRHIMLCMHWQSVFLPQIITPNFLILTWKLNEIETVLFCIKNTFFSSAFLWLIHNKKCHFLQVAYIITSFLNLKTTVVPAFQVMMHPPKDLHYLTIKLLLNFAQINFVVLTATQPVFNSFINYN